MSRIAVYVGEVVASEFCRLKLSTAHGRQYTLKACEGTRNSKAQTDCTPRSRRAERLVEEAKLLTRGGAFEEAKR